MSSLKEIFTAAGPTQVLADGTYTYLYGDAYTVDFCPRMGFIFTPSLPCQPPDFGQ